MSKPSQFFQPVRLSQADRDALALIRQLAGSPSTSEAVRLAIRATAQRLREAAQKTL